MVFDVFAKTRHSTGKLLKNPNFLSEGLLLTFGCSKKNRFNTLSSDNLVLNQSDKWYLIYFISAKTRHVNWFRINLFETKLYELRPQGVKPVL